MPLLRSRMRVHRRRWRFGVAFYLVMSAVTLVCAALIASRYLFGWW